MLLFLIFGSMAPAPTALVAAEEFQIQSIALYYKPTCPHSKKVLSYLRSQHISIPLKDVTKDKQAKEDLRVIGGYLIVPCLIVNGSPIYDASDIIQWLSEHRKSLETIHGN